jgi:hypothetical protein
MANADDQDSSAGILDSLQDPLKQLPRQKERHLRALEQPQKRSPAGQPWLFVL